MKITIWILLVVAVIAVAWEYFAPATPDRELIADVSVVEEEVQELTAEEQAAKVAEENALPEPPSAPIVAGEETDSEVDAVPDNAVAYALQRGRQLQWIGRKVGGQHNGVIDIQSADLQVANGDTIVGGEIVLDMDSLRATDIDNEGLDNHLKSPEYFNVDKHPTATFSFLDYDGGKLVGILTLNGVSKQIAFPASLTVEDDNVIADARFALDRTEWNIKGGIPAVSEYMELSFSMVWQPSN